MEEGSAIKQPLIVEKIDYLNKEIARLFEEVYSLECQLKPILTPEQPQLEASKEARNSPILISELLQDEIDKIITLQNQIGEIKKRLEI